MLNGSLWHLSLKKRHWLLAAMLLLLHMSVYGDMESGMVQSLMLAHMGIFFIWQPFWQGDQRLGWRGAGLSIIFTICFVWWLDWWLLLLWLMVLIGLTGGLTLLDTVERYVYLATMAFLISELLIGCVVNLFPESTYASETSKVFEYALFTIPATLLFVPRSAHSQQGSRSVDLFRGLTAALMTALVAFSSLFNSHQTGTPYPTALFQSLLGLAGFLFVTSWLFSPERGISGLARLWERSLLNIGTPFENWLSEIAQLADSEGTPDRFLGAAMDKLLELPWIEGVSWLANDYEGKQGRETLHTLNFKETGFTTSIYTPHPIGPTLLLHCNLLVKLLAHFYLAKLREQELARSAHLRAIHDTGARVTHDIKNLLQALGSITSALEAKPGEQSSDQNYKAMELMRRQLPHISQRLQLALSKLQAPNQEAHEKVSLRRWWLGVKSRDPGPNTRFTESLRADPLVPVELFDSVLENFMENARYKSRVEPDIRIAVHLAVSDAGVCLSVCDNGSALREEITRLLFKQPIRSDAGLGIGLFHAARQAELEGYSLGLKSSVAGKVCFELTDTKRSTP